MEHGPFDDKHDGPVHKAFRNGGKSAEFCATRHQALYEWETMRQLEEDTCHSDLVGVPPHPKQIPKSPWLVQSHCHDDWMNWGMQAWVTTGASDQFLRRLAIQLMNGACVWNCLGWRELGHFSTWMMLWPPFLQSRLYPTQCVLLLPMYERMTRARYNLGPQKTAVMCCYGADPPDIQNMQCSVYNVLGCFIDEHLILDNQEAFVLNVGKPCSRKFPTCPTSVVFLPCRCSGCRTKG